MTFRTYAADRMTVVAHPVRCIHTSVHREGVTMPNGDYLARAGLWRWFIAIGFDANGYYRDEGLAPTRKLAIRAIRACLESHFDCVPAEATLRVERGTERPFPTSDAQPFRQEVRP